jgi:salicylate 5-hydroxylase small subunit
MTGLHSLRVEAALRAQLDALYADAAAALDERRYDDWIELFADDCEYVLQPRENFDRGLPLATMALESKGMLRDRIHAIGDTLFHAPYYQRHVIGPLRIVRAGNSEIDVQANYAVFRTKLHEPTEVFNVGRYLDVLVPDPQRTGRWRIRSRRVVFDSELIPNSIIYPV